MSTNVLSVPGIGPILGHEERPAVCRICGAAFTQIKLSASMLKSPSIQAEIPGGFVPIFCPPCERYDMQFPGAIRPDVRKARAAEQDAKYEADERAAMADM